MSDLSIDPSRLAIISGPGGYAYQITEEDVFEAAKMVVGEGIKDTVALLWCMANRLVHLETQSWSRGRYPRLDLLIASYCQSINPDWRRDGKFCLPGGKGNGTDKCAPRRLDRRDRIENATLEELRERDDQRDAIDLVLLWAYGEVPCPQSLEGCIHFAVPSLVIKAEVNESRGGETSPLITHKGGNWFYKIPSTVSWGPEHVKVTAPAKASEKPGKALSLDREKTRLVQKFLNQAGRGQERLAVDGKFGAKTRKAVERFQRRNLMDVTGVVDEQTMALLSITASIAVSQRAVGEIQRSDWEGAHPEAGRALWRAKNDPDLARRRRRNRPIRACVVHTTGYGKGLQRIDKHYKDDPFEADEVYAERLANVLKHKAQFAVGRTGMVSQNAPLAYYTTHTASGHIGDYLSLWGRANGADMSWWGEIFPDLRRPTDLPGWGEIGPGTINKSTWSIDIVEPPPGQPYPPEQIKAAARLVAVIHTELGIPIDRKHVTTHSEINPLDRTTRSGHPWDLDPRRWDQGAFVEMARGFAESLGRARRAA